MKILKNPSNTNTNNNNNNNIQYRVHSFRTATKPD